MRQDTLGFNAASVEINRPILTNTQLDTILDNSPRRETGERASVQHWHREAVRPRVCACAGGARRALYGVRRHQVVPSSGTAGR